MNPPLSRIALVLVALTILLTGGDARAADVFGSAAEAGAAAASALSPGQLAVLIALGFLPAIVMIVRARRAGLRHR